MLFDTLRLFCLLAEHKSITKAAEEFHISQPAASARLKALEEAYGVPLFARRRGGLSITPAGKALLDAVEQILDTERGLRRKLRTFQGAWDSFLSIGATTGPGNYLLPKAVSSFRQHNPLCFVTLEVGDLATIEHGVRGGRFDLALVGSRSSANLKYESVRSDEIMLCTRGESPLPTSVRKSDLGGLPIVFEQRGSGSRAFLEEWLLRRGVELKDLLVTAELGLPEYLKRYLLLSDSAAFVSGLFVEEELKRQELRRIEIDDLPEIRRDLWLCTSTEQELSNHVTDFVRSYLKNK